MFLRLLVDKYKVLKNGVTFITGYPHEEVDLVIRNLVEETEYNKRLSVHNNPLCGLHPKEMHDDILITLEDTYFDTYVFGSQSFEEIKYIFEAAKEKNLPVVLYSFIEKTRDGDYIFKWSEYDEDMLRVAFRQGIDFR